MTYDQKEQLLNLLSQRRIWAGIVGFATIILSFLKISFDLDVIVLTDLLTAFGNALSILIMTVLALWSFFKPKN